MSIYVALLRGINVSGQRKVPMARLRALCEALGYTDVTTYLQSGNVVFRAPRRSTTALASALEERIAAELGFDVPVLVRTEQALRAVATANPLLDGSIDPASLHVVFLDGRPSTTALDAIDAARFAPDRFAARGSEIYLSCPNGYGRTKLTNTFFERQLDTRATTRNWKTVTNLVGLTQE
jgi:uncharacterized protein (DUF1697 family)